MRFWVLAVLAGCYRPSATPGAPCGPNGECPSGLSCVDNVCGGASSIDAAMAMDATDAPSPCDNVTCGTAEQPVCDPNDGTCRACIADNECASGMCNESRGMCIDEGNVLYVATSGSDATECTRTAPCLTITRAVNLSSAARDVIAVGAGTYNESVRIDNAGNLLISGPSYDRSQVVVTTGTLDDVLRVKNRHVFIETMRFVGGNDTARVDSSGFLTVVRADFEGGSSHGVEIQNGGFYCYGCVIANHGKVGVKVNSSGTIELDTNFIAGNANAGIDVNNASFDVINSAIAGNHGGGIAIALPLASPRRFEFNTVAFNDGTTTNLAIRSDTAFVASNSIFASNGTMPQVSPAVNVTYSLFSDVAAPGTGNLAGNPKFVNSSSDLHLQGNSPARDTADPAATLDYDYDGDARPHGTRSDMGADEI